MGLFDNLFYCDRKGKSYFPGQKDLAKGFTKACKQNKGLTQEDFLCSGKYVDQRVVMGTYGYDPCLNDEITFDKYKDPGGQTAINNEQFKSLLPLYIGLGLLVLGAGYLLVRKLKK